MAEYSNYSYQPQASQWLPENVFGQTSNFQMQDWIRSFPRPRHNRVMKPRSAGSSPSSVIRRRTTVAQSAMHGMSNQCHQSSLDAAILTSATRNSRPISWHPSSARSRGLSNPLGLTDYTSVNYVMGAMQDQTVNGLPTGSMMPYPLSAELTFPTGYFPTSTDMQDSFQQHTPSLPTAGSQVEPVTWDTTVDFDYSGMTQPVSDAWSFDMLSMANNIPPAETTCPSYASVPSPGEMSGPSTPDFLPIQQFDDEPASTQKKASKPEEELVGMGLYSNPSNALGQMHQETLGKGLKLEETFSPSDDEDDEVDAEGEVDEEAGDLGSTQHELSQQAHLPVAQYSNFPIPKQSSKQALNLMHKSFFFDHDDVDQRDMAAAQPYAGLNQQCMTYGYGWL